MIKIIGLCSVACLILSSSVSMAARWSRGSDPVNLEIINFNISDQGCAKDEIKIAQISGYTTIACISNAEPIFLSDFECPAPFIETAATSTYWKRLCINPAVAMRYPKKTTTACVSKFVENPNNNLECLKDESSTELKGDAGLKCKALDKKVFRIGKDAFYHGRMTCSMKGVEFESSQVVCKVRERQEWVEECWTQVVSMEERPATNSSTGNVNVTIDKGVLK